MTNAQIDFYKRLAHGIAEQFGSFCEVVVHDLEENEIDASIVAIENGELTGRKVGDGPSQIVLDAFKNGLENAEDKLSYLTRSKDGKTLRSSTIFIRNDDGKPIGVFAINYDISLLLAVRESLSGLINIDSTKPTAEPIAINVNDLLEELMVQSVQAVGKPVAIMTKEDKMKVIKYLNDTGAFLITKSGPRVCEFLGISKYTLYSYLEEVKQADSNS